MAKVICADRNFAYQVGEGDKAETIQVKKGAQLDGDALKAAKSNKKVKTVEVGDDEE